MHRIAIAAIAAALSFSAAATQMVFTDGALKITLTKAACPFEPLAEALGTVTQHPALVAEIDYQGRQIPGCWADGGDVVWIVDILGNSGTLDKLMLKPQAGI